MMMLSKIKGNDLIEMAAVVVVTGIIALGMTMGTRGVLLTIRQIMLGKTSGNME